MTEVSIVDEDNAVILDTLVNPGTPIPSDATRVHGITDSMVMNAPPAGEVVQRVLDIVADRHVVAYNAAFDSRCRRISRLDPIETTTAAAAGGFGARSPGQGDADCG